MGVTDRNAWSVRRSHAFHTWRLVVGGTRVFFFQCQTKKNRSHASWHGTGGMVPWNLTFGLQGFGILGFAIFW